MLRTVVFRRNKKQICWSVILRIAVYVMDMKIWRSFSHNTVLILPNIGLSNFYSYINKSVTRFVQSFSSDRFCKFLANCVQNSLACRFDFWSKRFMGAGVTARGVVIRLAVRAQAAYDCCATERARLVG